MNKSCHRLSLCCLFALSFLAISCNDGGQTDVEDSTATIASDTPAGRGVDDGTGIIAPDTIRICEEDNVGDDYYAEMVLAKMGYYDFDKIGDLNRFFGVIIKNHGTNIRGLSPEEYKDPNYRVKQCVSQIDNYRKGKRTFYPDSLVEECMGRLGFDCIYARNHAVNIDLTFAEWFLMCAAFYASDITCLVQTQTPDHRAGFYNFGRDYNGNLWWAYMFVKQKRGFEVIRAGRDEMNLTGVYQLEDKNHNKYYLFSNNLDACSFWQELYMVNGDRTERVLRIDRFPTAEEDESESVYFDMKEAVWQLCERDRAGIAHPIADRQKMRLILDGKKSRYEMIK